MGGEKTEHTRRERLCAKVVDLLCFACGEWATVGGAASAFRRVSVLHVEIFSSEWKDVESNDRVGVQVSRDLEIGDQSRGGESGVGADDFRELYESGKRRLECFRKWLKFRRFSGGGGGGGVGVGGRNDAAKDDTKDDVKDSTNLPSTSYETHVMRENSSVPTISSSHYTSGQHHHWSDEIVTFAQKFIAKPRRVENAASV